MDGQDFQIQRNLDSGLRRNDEKGPDDEKGGRNDEKVRPPKLQRYLVRRSNGPVPVGVLKYLGVPSLSWSKPMSTSSSSSQRRKRVYTKYGDQGETSLLYGGRVSKANPHTEAYGITDEAVSLMGLARALTDDDKVKNILRDLQRELFTVAAELATDPEKYDLFHQHFTPVTEQMVDNLEETIDELETHFQMPQVFILPGGTPSSSAMDSARTVIRTAERRVVALAEANGLTNPADPGVPEPPGRPAVRAGAVSRPGHPHRTGHRRPGLISRCPRPKTAAFAWSSSTTNPATCAAWRGPWRKPASFPS